MWKALTVLVAFSVIVAAAEVRISVTFDPKNYELSGSQWVKFSKPPKEAWFLLLANLGRERNPYVSPLIIDSIYVSGFDPSWTKIEKVVWEPAGVALSYELLPAPATYQTYSLADVLLRVELPAGPGELRIDFRTRFPHVWVEPGRLGDIYTWRFGWHPILLPERPGEVFPFMLPFYEYKVELELPEGWQAFLPGNAKVNGRRFSTSFDKSVESVALFFGPEERFRSVALTVAGRELVGVALPGNESGLRALLTWVPEILSWYEERFGPYPHRRLLLVEHPSRYGMGMAAEGMVFLSQWFFSRENLTAAGILTRLNLYILAHELAHLWFGIGVGVDFDAENWLSEGFAQYLSITWYEERFGSKGGNVFVFDKKGLAEELVDYFLGFVNLREHFTEFSYLRRFFSEFDEAIVKPTREVRYDQATYDRIYNKGYLVVRALAAFLGEEVFQAGVRRFLEKYRGQISSVQSFRKILENTSGLDLSQFFADWVFGEAWADYGIAGFSLWPTSEGYVVELDLTYKGTGILPVLVELRGPEEKKKTFVWNPTGAFEERITISLDFPALEVVVDPEHRVLDVDRLNNRWPRRYVLAMKNDFPLDAYLLRVGPGSFSLTYLDRFGFTVSQERQAVEGFVNFGRKGRISGRAQVQETLLGALTFTRALWATPKTGSAATYWEEVGSFSISLGRLPEWAFGLRISWQEGVARVRAGEASGLFMPEHGFGLSLRHTELFGFAPNFHPSFTISLGFASPELPERFWPTLVELRSLPFRKVPAGRYKVAGILGFWLPPYLLEYFVAGAALVSEVRPRVFLSAGQIWTDPAERKTYLEVGGELWITVEVLGGLPIRVVVGLAYPILPRRPAVLYFGLGQ